MQSVSRDVIRLLSQVRVIFQIAVLERSDTLDWSRSLHRLPLVVLRHLTAQGAPRARLSGATRQRRYSRISRDE
jgi:hypothetical protein